MRNKSIDNNLKVALLQIELFYFYNKTTVIANMWFNLPALRPTALLHILHDHLNYDDNEILSRHQNSSVLCV